MSANDYSIVEYFGEQTSNHCGYCKNTEDVKYSTGMWAHVMSVRDYGDLLDRGWRRSGKYTYKPTMDRTCCPMYTIRCHANQFTATRSQRRAARKFIQYLVTGKAPKPGHLAPKKDKPSQIVEKTTANPVESIGFVPDRSKKCTKAKYKRRERWRQKMIDKGIKPEDVDKHWKCRMPPIASIEQLLNWDSLTDKLAHTFTTRLVRSHPASPQFQDSLQESHKLYHKYQTVIHGDSPDTPSMQQYSRFLCESPLELVRGQGEHPGYGSFHQQYILDGKIIGVGVIDILPRCISSKYFYYDPDFEMLSLGVISALNEVLLTRQLSKQSPLLQYYYMGFYIHCCPKMKYKAMYSPSDLLCPVTYKWKDVKLCQALLDNTKYTRFKQGQAPDPPKIDTVMLLYNRTPTTVAQYRKTKPESHLEDIREYATLVGSPALNSMLLYRE